MIWSLYKGRICYKMEKNGGNAFVTGEKIHLNEKKFLWLGAR